MIPLQPNTQPPTDDNPTTRPVPKCPVQDHRKLRLWQFAALASAVVLVSVLLNRRT